jgi:DMSO/TMAO reductase YedYZ molybdopterin-dependent catalytic subunit
MLGAAAGLAATLLLTVLRIAAGIPLPVETVSDRFLPLVPVDRFLQLLGLVGGPIVAKEIAYASAFVLQVGLGVVAGALLALQRGRVTLALAAVLAVIWLAAVVVLWPALGSGYVGRPPALAALLDAVALLLALAVAGVVLAAGMPARRDARPGRRSFLLAAGGLVMAAAIGVGAVSLFRRGAFGYDGMVLRGPVAPVTPNDRFYVVTKNLIDPEVDPAAWRLTVGGLVRLPYELSLGDLAAVAHEHMEATLECISNGVGYGLLSNAVWTGIPMRDLLDRAGPRAEAGFVALRSSDGYTYGLPLEKASAASTLVAHQMNGRPLPGPHGFPARAVVPGRYGEASVKWLTEIEVRDRPLVGYYESQGWRSDFVHTTSRIDAPQNGQRVSLANGPVTVQGVAFAGDRGVSAVEVTDDGRNWMDAGITYAGSPLTWALWSLSWTPARPGSYALQVRARDGAGALQEARRQGFAPSGATGYHARQVTVDR